MRYDLRAMMRRAGVRRRRVVFRPIRVKPAHVQRLLAAYMPVLRRWEAVLPRIMAVYERIHGDGRATDSLTVRDTAADVDEIERLIALIVFQIEEDLMRIVTSLSEWANVVEGWHREAWRDTVLRATDIDVGTMLGPHDVGETVRAVTLRNAELVRDLSAEARGRIADATLRGVQNVTPPRQVAKELAGALDMGTERAKRVAADQSAKLLSSLDQARQEEAGVDHFTWRHSGKKHPRKDHVARNGNIYKWRASTPGPGLDPPADLPGQLPWCGCVAQATLIDENGKAL